MKRIPWFLNPVLIFIGSLVAVIISLILFIYWSLRTQFGVENFIQKFNLSPDPLLELNTWVTIFTLSILVVVIIIGLFIIYIYYQKSINLYRLQNNFINNFTHELRTPLTSINLFLETLRGHDIERDNQIKYIDYMSDDAARLGSIINHILSTAKIESNSYKKNVEVIELSEMIKNVSESIPGLKNKINIHFEKKFKFYFEGDRELLEMLFLNLVTNAAKYNESESPTLQIEMTKNQKSLVINFIDNGIGIESDQIKKIFKKFYQVGDSLNVSAKGSGLGLFLAQMIAQMHKCKIMAKSNGLGHGSCFSFICPLSKEARGLK